MRISDWIRDEIKEHGGHYGMGMSASVGQIRFDVVGDEAIAYFLSHDFLSELADQKWFVARSSISPSEKRGGKGAALKLSLESLKGEKAYHVPELLYHVTYEDLVPRIKELGLRPHKSSRPELHNYPPRLFMATSEKAARTIMSQFRKLGDERPFAVFAVDVGDFPNGWKKDCEFKSGGVWIDHPIPSQYLKRVHLEEPLPA